MKILIIGFPTVGKSHLKDGFVIERREFIDTDEFANRWIPKTRSLTLQQKANPVYSAVLDEFNSMVALGIAHLHPECAFIFTNLSGRSFLRGAILSGFVDSARSVVLPVWRVDSEEVSYLARTYRKQTSLDVKTAAVWQTNFQNWALTELSAQVPTGTKVLQLCLGVAQVLGSFDVLGIQDESRSEWTALPNFRYVGLDKEKAIGGDAYEMRRWAIEELHEVLGARQFDGQPEARRESIVFEWIDFLGCLQYYQLSKVFCLQSMKGGVWPPVLLDSKSVEDLHASIRSLSKMKDLPRYAAKWLVDKNARGKACEVNPELFPDWVAAAASYVAENFRSIICPLTELLLLDSGFKLDMPIRENL